MSVNTFSQEPEPKLKKRGRETELEPTTRQGGMAPRDEATRRILELVSVPSSATEEQVIISEQRDALCLEVRTVVVPVVKSFKM